MCSDIELFINLIYMTDIMNNLQDENFNQYVQEIINLNNYYINKAIKEVLQNERFINKIKEDTNIEIDRIKIL